MGSIFYFYDCHCRATGHGAGDCNPSGAVRPLWFGAGGWLRLQPGSAADRTPSAAPVNPGTVALPSSRLWGRDAVCECLSCSPRKGAACWDSTSRAGVGAAALFMSIASSDQKLLKISETEMSLCPQDPEI